MRIPKAFVFSVIALIVVFYGYKALRFNEKVKAFDTRIQIGDSMAKVIRLMGQPSGINPDYPVGEELVVRYGLKTRDTILLVYRGIYFLREDLNFAFNPDTGELIEKDRAIITWWSSFE